MACNRLINRTFLEASRCLKATAWRCRLRMGNRQRRIAAFITFLVGFSDLLAGKCASQDREPIGDRGGQCSVLIVISMVDDECLPGNWFMMSRFDG